MDSPEAQVATESLRAVYRQLPTTISAVLGAAFLVFLLADIHPDNLLYGWFGLVVVDNGIAAGLLYLYYIKSGQSDLSHPRWKRLFYAFIVCTGIVWGMIGVIFYDAPIEYKLLIVVWLWALGAGMAALLVAHKPSFYAMVMFLLLPLIIRLALDTDTFYRSLSAATFLWMTTLMYFHHVNHKTLFEAMHLRFINARLVSDLARKSKEAESANLAKSQFLAAASHDLRQPLHAQGLFLAELDRHVDSPTGRRILGGLESSIYAMRKLLNAILDISKLDAGTIVPSTSSFPVATLFSNLRSEFAALAAEKTIALRIHKCNLAIRTDPVLLESILRNLIANAIRYTGQGGVLVGCRRQGQSVRIQVLDTGIGIPEDKQDDIFTPFIQLGNPERDREKGLGLGLSIVRRTAEILGHPLSLRSERGKGTVVSISVPLSDQALAVTRKEPSISSMTDISGVRVLVIDDDHDVRTAMQGLLDDWGCQAVVFPGAGEALRYLEKKEVIDVILSDFSLSGDVNGIQAIGALRESYGSTIPAALVTGDTSIDRLREADESGIPIIHKPVLAGELRALISELAGQSR